MPSKVWMAITSVAIPATTAVAGKAMRNQGQPWRYQGSCGLSLAARFISAWYQESGFFVEAEGRVILGRDLEGDLVGAGLARVIGNQNLKRDRLEAGRAHIDALLATNSHAGQPRYLELECSRHLGHVHDLQLIHVLDQPTLDLATKGGAIADDVDAQGLTQGQTPDETDAHDAQHGTVDQCARPQHVADDFLSTPMPLHRVFGRVTDKAPRIVHLVHDLVARVDARRTTDALVLQAVTDVDAGRTDLHADAAVDAVALAHRARVDALLARSARLAALLVIGDDQGVRVEHHRLEAGVRAHVRAHLLAHDAGEQVGECRVEQDPEGFPRTE